MRLTIAAAFAALITAFGPLLAGGQARHDTELRGLWVLRTTLTSPSAIEQLVARASDAGINALFVQVRGRGDALYTSALEPRSTLLARQPASFDPLATVIRLAQGRGIAVHAWVNVGLVSDAVGLPASPQHLIRRHPEWLMVPREIAPSLARMNPRAPAYVNAIARWTRANSAKVEGLFVSPLHAGARAHATAIARDLASRYALDGLHLDYVRYPHDGFDQQEPPDVRRARVSWLVKGMADAAREARPGIAISAAVLPEPETARNVKLQDWPAWAASGIVDALCPMAYATERPAFTSQIDAVRVLAGKARVWTGIGAYRLTARETASRIVEARRAGASGVLLFSYDSVITGPRGSRYLQDVSRAAFLTLKP